ncbi:MAG: transketolase [Bilophila wadsworthia]
MWAVLSLIEALVYLYYEEMRVRPEEPGWPDRDHIVLSKGHGPRCITLLAMKGYFDKGSLLTLNQPGTRLPSHCDMKLTTGIDMTAGSLGQGLSAAVGMALAARMERKDYRVYCIVGDGEQQEGQIWEAAMYAGSQELDNLVVLVDDNGMQIDDYTDAINAVRPLDKRWEAFGWATLCIDGHNFSDLEAALTHARTIKKRPTAIIMATVKGKGLSVAEGKLSSHNMPLSPEDVAAALQELQ